MFLTEKIQINVLFVRNRTKLVTLISADIKELTKNLDIYSQQQTVIYPAFKTELLAGIEEIKNNIKNKLEYLKTGDVESTRHVRLVEYLANKYNIDKKIR